jgi:hypothetical protein
LPKDQHLFFIKQSRLAIQNPDIFVRILNGLDIECPRLAKN